jgi:hypothetical protein
MKRRSVADYPHIIHSYECPCGEAWDGEADDNRCPVCGRLCPSAEEIEIRDDLDDGDLWCGDDAA